ncbi:hypothetical protein [Streptomyces sp. DT171]|uniref:hypothetical protein n=1 Tax=Streptomyces sp. DT171 TaxID=3416524 RepID=UPI003CF6638C
MNTKNSTLNLDWIPSSGFQLRKAGVQFDAVRVDGGDGCRLAKAMRSMVAGEPGPIIIAANGRRGVYFLLPAGSAAHKSWPEGVTRLNSAPGHVCYVPVPALTGRTWPLSWYVPPTTPDRFVHPLLLLNAANSLLG